ncbi:hypothetical protein [Haloarchaeobius sp. DFWS5]|uniref:hypothetical protein n=1 Tax=Haloarchaeobius sp. DFWS5 TaxID=3446114 RepID=UPI003EBC4D09
MSVDSVRKVRNIGLVEATDGEIGTLAEIEFELEAPSEHEVLLDDSPFDEVEKQVYSFTYESEPLFGSPTTASGSIELRIHSGLVILNSSDDRPRPKTIFKRFREYLAELSGGPGNIIQDDFYPELESIREFIKRADVWIDVRAIKPDGSTIQITENGQTKLDEYPIDRAKLRFSYYDRGEQKETTVVYSDDQLHIRTDNSTLREYVLQQFEAALKSTS